MVEEGAISRHFNADRLTGEARSQRLLVRLTHPVGSRVTVFARAGGADLALPQFDSFQASLTPAYGGGLRVALPTLPTAEPWHLFAMMDVLTGQASSRVISADCLEHTNCRAGTALPRAGDEEMTWTESSVVFGAEVRRGTIEPQIGVRLSWLTAHDRLTLRPDARFPALEIMDGTIQQEAVVGVVIGAELTMDRAERTALALEGRFFDVYGGVIRFRVNF